MLRFFRNLYVQVLLAIIAGAGSRTGTLRQLVIDTLADRLDSEVQLETFSVDTFPTVHVTGTNLIIRHKGRKDVPPLVSVASFQLDGGLFGLLSRPRRFRTVSLTGLQINIPPGFKKDTQQAAATSGHASHDDGPAAIVVDTMEANDAALTLIPKRAVTSTCGSTPTSASRITTRRSNWPTFAPSIRCST